MFSKVEAQDNAFWRKFRQRSVLKTTLTDELCDAVMKQTESEQVIMKVMKQTFSNFAHSGLVEDSFQRMRAQENLNEGGAKVAANRLWKIATDSKLLTDVYGYREVEAKSIPEKKVESLPASFFQASTSRTSVPMEDVAGTSTVPPWTSFSPPFMQYSEDLGLLEFLHSKPHLWNNVWRTTFLQAGLVCRNKKVFPEQRFLCFGSSTSGLCCLLWPVRESTKTLKKKNLTTWELCEVSDPSRLKWLPVVDFSDWIVTPCSYYSPLHLFCLNANVVPSSFGTAMVQSGPETPLLKFAAQTGFWNLNLQTLKKLCKEWTGSRFVPWGSSEFDVPV